MLGDDDTTPKAPMSTTGIALADLCATEIAYQMHLRTLPVGCLAIIMDWQQRAVARALEPERRETDRLRVEVERLERVLEQTQRELGAARMQLRREQ